MDQVKALILKAANAWEDYRRVPSRSSRDVTEHVQAGPRATEKKNVYCHLSGLEDVMFNETRKITV